VICGAKSREKNTKNMKEYTLKHRRIIKTELLKMFTYHRRHKKRQTEI
jgi:hypothetical protein